MVSPTMISVLQPQREAPAYADALAGFGGSARPAAGTDTVMQAQRESM